MKFIAKIRKFIGEQETLEDRIFCVVLMVGVIIVAVSTMVTFVEDLSPIANVSTAAAIIFILFEDSERNAMMMNNTVINSIAVR